MENIKLYNHNEQTYNNIVKLWSAGINKVGVVQATGTGKSYVISKCCTLFEDKKILILAPKVHILKSLKEMLEPFELNITYMTYTKLNLLDDESFENLKPDLIVLDEFHRCGSNAWGRAVDKLLNAYSYANVLGTTATNIRYLDNCRDMAIEIFDDNLACKTNLIDAINEGILPAPTYITSLYSLDEEIASISKRVKVGDSNYDIVVDKLDKLKNWNASIGVPNILKKHLDGSVNKFIVFCKSEKHLNEVYHTVIQWFEEAEILDGVKSYKVTFKSKGNEQAIEEFKSGEDNLIHLLFSIDILNEGLHIDSTGVVLLRETNSPTVFLQQIGRALSVTNTKPIIFDFVNNFNSLKVNDLEKMIVESKKRIHEENERIVTPVDFKLYDETKPIRELLDDINSLIFSDWDDKYDKISLFYKINGHCVVPSPRENKEYTDLYKWSLRQRYLINNNQLSEDRIKKLQAINFPLDLKFAKWVLKYLELAQYYKEYGNTKVPKSVNSSLYHFCIMQRMNKGELSEYQISLLNKLNFKWNVLDEEFEEKIIWLLDYKAEYGDLLVPRRYPKNPKLANTVALFRQNKEKGILPQEKIDRLDKIGFVWNIEEYNWNLCFKELKEYFININFTGGKIPSYPSEQIRTWVSRQRVAYKKGRLSNERKAKLESIGLVFEVA